MICCRERNIQKGSKWEILETKEREFLVGIATACGVDDDLETIERAPRFETCSNWKALGNGLLEGKRARAAESSYLERGADGYWIIRLRFEY